MVMIMVAVNGTNHLSSNTEEACTSSWRLKHAKTMLLAVVHSFPDGLENNSHSKNSWVVVILWIGSRWVLNGQPWWVNSWWFHRTRKHSLHTCAIAHIMLRMSHLDVFCLGSLMSQVLKSCTETNKNRSIHGVDITAMNMYVEVQVWTNWS